MKRAATLLLYLFSATALATLPLEASLEQLASKADHILAGHVIGVDMIDSQGKEITDENAMSGPGLRNTIRLVVRVEDVFFSRAKAVPERIKIPLDPAMHYSLGQIKHALRTPSKTFLLILRGESFQPIVAGVFARPLHDKDSALEIRSKTQGSNKTMERTR